VLGGGLPSDLGALGSLFSSVRCGLGLLRQVRDPAASTEAGVGCYLSELTGTLRRLARGSTGGRCCGAGPLCGIVHLFGPPGRALHVSRCRSSLRRLRRLAGFGGACFGLPRFLIRNVCGLGCLVHKFGPLGNSQCGRCVLRRGFPGGFGPLHCLFRTFSRCLGSLHETADRGVVSHRRFLSHPSGTACRPRCRFGLGSSSRCRLACSHCRAACLLRRPHSALSIPGYRSVIRRSGGLARLCGASLGLLSLSIRRSGCLNGLC
jgi:hypothetical protein